MYLVKKLKFSNKAFFTSIPNAHFHHKKITEKIISILINTHSGDYDNAINTAAELYAEKSYNTDDSLLTLPKVSTSHKTPPTPLEWLVHILAGDAQGLKGEWEEAMKEFNIAMTLKSCLKDNCFMESLYYRIANAQIEISKRVSELDTSLEHLLRSKQMASTGLVHYNNSQILNHLKGSSLLLLKEYKSALNCFSESVLNSTENAREHMFYDSRWILVKSMIGMGLALHSLNDYPKALEAYRRGLKLIEQTRDYNNFNNYKQNSTEHIMREFGNINHGENLINKALDWCWWTRPGILKELHLQKLETITLYNMQILKYYELFNQKTPQNNHRSSNNNILSGSSLSSSSIFESKITTKPRIPVDPKSILTPTHLSKLLHLAGYYHLFKNNDYHAAYKKFLHAQFQDASILEGWLARRDILDSRYLLKGDSSIINQNNDFYNDDIDINGSEVEYEDLCITEEEDKRMIEHELLTDASSAQSSTRFAMINDVIMKMMREEWGGNFERKQGVKERMVESFVENIAGVDLIT
ncbi:160_t:CDS:2 [Ambispora leptoticha]|uniref:160_t:CDS:1 n=1 Tax=Ambispora leptoticha TaxID=144679 RepID=A0A9N9F4K0_9GLOM|nr:160_t:CDS:2 [Ambispora leptoticha]